MKFDLVSMRGCSDFRSFKPFDKLRASVLLVAKRLRTMLSRLAIPGVACLCLTLFSGCLKYYELSDSEFPQANKKHDQREVTAAYKRSVVAYDQFETKARFDALWLSEEARTAYGSAYAHKRGMSADAREELLKRQLEETKHWIAFYLLVEQRSTTPSLSDPLTAWTCSLQIDQHTLVQESIKECDLEAEYQQLFGGSFNGFKTCYLLKFAVTPELAEKINTHAFKKLQLKISSPQQEVAMAWLPGELHGHKKVVSDHEDFYWG
ncbi:hypothetical protein EBZ39_11165 [bacterium]|nr:hypothetical protein [bacterium]